MSFIEQHFKKIYWALCSLVGLVVILRCYFTPFAHDEVATFFYYIQPGKFLPFKSHVDANGHFLMSATGWFCFKLFGSSVLALRLPCVMAFFVLCYAVNKVNDLLQLTVQKMVFSSAFILSFNFIAFYSLCRGYGLSMAFLVLALYYFFVYASSFSFKHFLKFVLFIQIALSANLTLIFVVLISTAMLMFFQIKNKLFFKIKNVLLLVLQFGLLIFWIKYALYLQDKGALYYGEGENYWKTTFVSLIETTLSGQIWIKILVCLLFVGMSGYFLYKLVREKTTFLFNSPFALAFVALVLLIKIFYVLKLVLNVNYPEDRTGLFFYVFFVFSLAFMISEVHAAAKKSFWLMPLLFVGQWVFAFNLKAHPWRIYETMPQAFFDKLVEEQSGANYPITVGGHRVRELFYGFQNYNSPVKLSQCTAPEALQLNCDYAIAYKQDKPYYATYYNELLQDDYWDFTLIKRKVPITRNLLFSTVIEKELIGSVEYYNLYEKLDTTFNSVNPLLAEFNLDVEMAPLPFNTWLVLQVDGENEANSSFIRTPLNLIRYDWNGIKNFTTCITSPVIPLKIKRIVVYLWNMDKQEIKIRINSFKLYNLQGEGVNSISKARL